MTWQTFPGFALGFVLWGLSSSLMSGTFESAGVRRAGRRATPPSAYPSLIGWAHSTALVANLAATVVAAPLLALGGYPLVGWTSVAICGGQALLAATLPVSEQARRPARHDSPLAETERAASRYLAMLRAGLAESRHHPDVRRILLLAAAMVGLTAYDEYFPLVARAHGVATPDIPLLIAITVAGQAVGTALVGPHRAADGARGRGASWPRVPLLVSLGALVTPYAGFVAIGDRLRGAQQRDARRRDPAAGRHHRSRASHRDQRARPPRGGRGAHGLRRRSPSGRTCSASRPWWRCWRLPVLRGRGRGGAPSAAGREGRARILRSAVPPS